jgi:acyl-CoA thioesterase-1
VGFVFSWFSWRGARLDSPKMRRWNSSVPRRAIWPALLLLAAAACGSRDTLTSPTPGATPIRRVVVLGDSLAVSPSIAESFPTALQARVDAQRLRWAIVNAGVNGDTTADGLRRLDPLLASDVAILVVELGANDGLQGVPVSTIQQNLLAIVQRARERSVRPLLCGMETPPGHGLDYSVAFHFVFPTIAQQQSVPLVPFLLAGVALVPELNGPDLVHPNAAGARRIADTVWTYLAPMLQN